MTVKEFNHGAVVQLLLQEAAVFDNSTDAIRHFKSHQRFFEDVSLNFRIAFQIARRLIKLSLVGSSRDPATQRAGDYFEIDSSNPSRTSEFRHVATSSYMCGGSSNAVATRDTISALSRRPSQNSNITAAVLFR